MKTLEPPEGMLDLHLIDARIVKADMRKTHHPDKATLAVDRVMSRVPKLENVLHENMFRETLKPDGE